MAGPSTSSSSSTCQARSSSSAARQGMPGSSTGEALAGAGRGDQEGAVAERPQALRPVPGAGPAGAGGAVAQALEQQVGDQ